ncbi:hypothetical protein M0813_05568 [Anaeramoeba flamelloides]|uniref:Uncharacterized protein n=1 Tax=Anaeramoeba flamelloides TaxID=1746091 RepID=A0ABQ8XGR3_9EUKA|nr:hypothetical protein M0813_05568 [Anaeramoeba flamelloides]
MNITWQGVFDTTIIATISLFNMDIATIITPDCYQNWDFYSKYLMMVLAPIFLITLIILCYLFLKVIRFVNTNIFLISEKVDNINFEKLNIKFFYFITLCCRYLYIPETIITRIPFQKTWQTALKKYTLNYYPNISTDDEKYQNFYPWKRENINHTGKKISPEDLLTIGLYLVLIEIISSNIEELKNIFFLVLSPIGIVLAFMGTRKNLKEMWYRQKNSKLNGDDEINESRMKRISFVVSENPNLHANAKKLSDKNEKINDENQNSLSTTSSPNTDSSSNSSSNFDTNDSQNENDIELNGKNNSDVELKNVKIKINSIGDQKIGHLKQENEKLKLTIDELVDEKKKYIQDISTLKEKILQLQNDLKSLKEKD